MGKIYDKRRWRRLRRKKLSADPLCEYCPAGKITPATQVDHVLAINDGGDPWAWDNLKSTCAPCHSSKTRYIEQMGRDRVPVRGVDPATGLPIDPEHWWNK